MSLHPLTLKSIEALPLLYPDDEQAAYYECGCYRHTDIWTLCTYHQGYEDGVQAQQERLDEAVRLLRAQRDGQTERADLLAVVVRELQERTAKRYREAEEAKAQLDEAVGVIACALSDCPGDDEHPRWQQQANDFLLARIDGGEQPNG